MEGLAKGQGKLGLLGTKGVILLLLFVPFAPFHYVRKLAFICFMNSRSSYLSTSLFFFGFFSFLLHAIYCLDIYFLVGFWLGNELFSVQWTLRRRYQGYSVMQIVGPWA